MYSGMAKCTSRAEATLNSKKYKPLALAIIELWESEGIRQARRHACTHAGRQAGRQAVSQSVENSVKINFFKIL